MARNQEKKNSLLNRYLRYIVQGEDPNARRPALAASVDTLAEADRWRRDVVKEITRKSSEIQNSLLPEQRIRDLNDELNKLLRVKYHWDRRVEELGGPGHRSQPQLTETALAARGSRYWYFGAARDLPGVRELFFTADPTEDFERSRAELYRGIDARYYGFADECQGDSAWVRDESAAERASLVEALTAERGGVAPDESEVDAVLARWQREEQVGFGADGLTGGSLESARHLTVPSHGEIAAVLLDKRKRDLLVKYGMEA